MPGRSHVPSSFRSAEQGEAEAIERIVLAGDVGEGAGEVPDGAAKDDRVGTPEYSWMMPIGLLPLLGKPLKIATVVGDENASQTSRFFKLL